MHVGSMIAVVVRVRQLMLMLTLMSVMRWLRDAQRRGAWRRVTGAVVEVATVLMVLPLRVALGSERR